MNPKVSIVVPIYNVQEYLGRCLDSLLNQTLSEIEILAINDGSTDSSGRILREYADKDTRIKVVEKQNGGVSSARNYGIKLSSGDYIGFVDPDDWVDSFMYKELYSTAVAEDADIVMCTYTREYGTHSKVKNFNFPSRLSFNKDEINKKVLRRLVGPLDEELTSPEMLDAWGTVWSKLYRADIIKDNNILFTDLSEIGTNEDSLFNMEIFYYARSFIFLNSPYYHYWKLNSNAVTEGFKPDLLNQWFNLYEKINKFIENKNLEHDYFKALNNRICMNTLGLGLNTIGHDNKSSLFLKYKKVSFMLNDYRIKRSFKQLELSKFPFVWRTFYFFAKHRFTIGFYLMLITIEHLRKIVR